MAEIYSEPYHLKISELIDLNHNRDIWEFDAFEDGRNLAKIIGEPPEYPLHFSVQNDFNEWWVVLKGSIRISIDSDQEIFATSGDIIRIPSGNHEIQFTTNLDPCVRLVVTQQGSEQVINTEEIENSSQSRYFSKSTNTTHISLDDVINEFENSPWTSTILEDERNRANLICHNPGMSNNPHWHPAFHEWWTILKGSLTWEVGDNRPIIHAEKGDLIFVPKGFLHKITTVSDETSLRLAITTPEDLHIYTTDDDYAPPPKS
ncbi:MAG: hypothetical protein CL734_00030 [Chloroflexi bacterium]|nr:hypothetical protein [Chloroflexota bacterium]